jgi:hypothetical protein
MPLPDDLCDQPLNIVLFKGAVVLNGPGNVALAMTVDAAERSAQRLVQAVRRLRRTKRRAASVA